MTDRSNSDLEPVCLLVPGIDNSGPGHWQTEWEGLRADCERVDLGNWDDPDRTQWATRLGDAIRAISRPVVLVAHSLGCHAVTWWAGAAGDEADKIAGAMLVAPPQLFDQACEERLTRYRASTEPLPFPSIVVGSRDDPFASFANIRAMASAWGSRLVDAGWLGHINALSGLGRWSFGEALLDRIVLGVTQPIGAVLPDALRPPRDTAMLVLAD